MKNRIGFLLVFIWIIIAGSPALASVTEQKNPGEWKAGVAREVITPDKPLWLAGYSSRTHLSEGKLHDLWMKALAIEDEQGNRAVLITSDLLGFPKDCSDNIRNILQKELNLSKSQIILNGSHTHTGPVLAGSLADIYPMDSTEWGEVGRYTAQLERQVVQTVKKAFSSMVPASIMTGNGTTRFQVNRRNNNEKTLNALDELKGPNDYSVPVIKIAGKDGQILAIIFGYACHGTVLNDYLWSGDYPGFAQIELEKWYPGTTAMFFQGAAGDQNPLPRRSVALAQQYGTELASAVRCVLNDKMKPVPATLSTSYSEIELPLEEPVSDQELTTMATQLSGYQQKWAKKILQEKHDHNIISSYPYPIELWNIGGQLLVALGGEPVIEYSRKIKQLLGPHVFVLGYSNDLLGYIPTTEIIQEGGYEGDIAQMACGLPGKWKPGIEKIILDETIVLAEKTGFLLPKEIREKAKDILAGENRLPDSSQKPPSKKIFCDEIEVAKIWDKAPHNAFTDIIRFNSRFFCTFREGTGHVPGETGEDGKIRILASTDGEKWESFALLEKNGYDLRDSKLSVTPDGRLMVLMGGSNYDGTTLANRLTHVSFLGQNNQFSEPVPVKIDKKIRSGYDWLWRVTWYGDTGYGVVYQKKDKTRSEVFLVETQDGINYRLTTALNVDNLPGESTVCFTPEGEMLILMRCDGGARHGLLGLAKPPYKEWAWNNLGIRLGGPDIIPFNTSYIIGTRSFSDEGSRTALFLSQKSGFPQQIIELPSGGDTSYPGLLFYNDTLWVSYYSSHEGKAAIYLAKIPAGRLNAISDSVKK